MAIELSPEVNNRIDLKHRLELEVLLMRSMLENPEDDNEKMSWINVYAEIVRAIIFSEEGKRICELANEDKYDEAVSILREELNKRLAEQDRKAA